MSATEVRLFRQALKEAQKNLVRWRTLGKRFHRTLNPNWRQVLKLRQQETKPLRALIQLAKHSS
jgi:hypothetical protein